MERHILDIKKKTLKACLELPDDVDFDELIDFVTAAHNDTIKQGGASPWKLLLGWTPPGLGLQGAQDAGLSEVSRRAV